MISDHILLRQLRKAGLSADEVPASLEAWQSFLGRVEIRYAEMQRLNEQFERTLTKSLEEMEMTVSKLQVAQAEIIRSSRLVSIGTLAAGIAHEINNAINFVNGSLMVFQKCMEEAESPCAVDKNQQLKLLKAMNEGVSLIIGIVNSLREHAGTNEAKADLPVNLRQCAETVLKVIHHKIGHRVVRNEIPAELFLSGSRTAYSQILMNLVSNAIDATTDQGIIDIKAEDQGGAVLLQVVDNGSGIAGEIMDQIFDPFFTTKPVNKGMGLGLYITRREVQSQNGTISAHSNPQGTTFLVLFQKVKPEMTGALSA